MTLADRVLELVSKLRELPVTSTMEGDEWIDEADVLRIANDLEFAARAALEKRDAE